MRDFLTFGWSAGLLHGEINHKYEGSWGAVVHRTVQFSFSQIDIYPSFILHFVDFCYYFTSACPCHSSSFFGRIPVVETNFLLPMCMYVHTFGISISPAQEREFLYGWKWWWWWCDSLSSHPLQSPWLESQAGERNEERPTAQKSTQPAQTCTNHLSSFPVVLSRNKCSYVTCSKFGCWRW